MKADLHVHSRPASLCAQFKAEDIPQKMKSVGIGLFNLCNHYYPSHLEQFGDKPADQVEGMIKTWENGRKAAEAADVTMIFGIEVKLINVPCCPEFVLYGITPELLRKNPLPFYSFTQKELFDFCHVENLLMYQAHPYRTEQGYRPADPKYMDGMEIYNGHVIFDPKYEMTKAFIDSHGLAFTAGSDFHDPDDLGHGGIILPDNCGIKDSEDLRDWLKENPHPEIYTNAAAQ